MHKGLTLLGAILLQGCVGSYVYHGEDQMDDFGALNQVPKRPEEPQWKAYAEEEVRLTALHKELANQAQASKL